MLRLGKEIMIFDGGFGSELQRRGLNCAYVEELNITHAEEIRDIHRAYAAADFITTNTFGLNRIKYRGKYDIASLANAAIENARVAGKKVFFDVGPTGAMMQPIGTLSFDEAYGAYAEIARLTRDKVDGYILETFSDLYEIKACVLAVKENSDKPIFATMTFDETGRTLTGSTPEIAAALLEGLGVDALGVNCSLGPKELESIVARLVAVSGIPVIVQPNCGLPEIADGKAVYKTDIDEFDRYIRKFIGMGVSVVGGCCGTTPRFIERIAAYRGRKVRRRRITRATAVCSAVKMTVMDGVKICGERLNPTGKKKLKEALLNEDYAFLAGEAIRQEEAGADLLDLNVGLPQTDEPLAMKQAVLYLQQYTQLPLQIDSSDARAVELGARYYNGIPLINSVNGDDAVLDRVLPIAAKYGAVVLGLTMDSHGVPNTARGRVEIAKKIIRHAQSYGIPRHKVMIDTLVLTAAAEQAQARETVEALARVRRLGVKTALGVSNVSFGLPNRGLLNKTFLTMAMTAGLNMPILNPLDSEMTGAVKAFGVLSNDDEGAQAYISAYKDFVPAAATVQPSGAQDREKPETDALFEAVIRGRKEEIAALTAERLKTENPLEITDGVIVKALERVGELFDGGKLFLPQLVASAEAAKTALAVIGEKFPKGGSGRGKVILATVKGDVHDIGKNIVRAVLESYGYKVIDLGKDTPIESVVQAYEKHKPIAIGLSALMTTTVESMKQTVQALREIECDCPIFAGGAVLTESIARQIGADYYTKNALEFVKALETVTK